MLNPKMEVDGSDFPWVTRDTILFNGGSILSTDQRLGSSQLRGSIDPFGGSDPERQNRWLKAMCWLFCLAVFVCQIGFWKKKWVDFCWFGRKVRNIC